MTTVEIPGDVRLRLEAHLLAPDRVPLADLGDRFLTGARTAYFVLHRAPDIDVLTFLDVVLPRLLRRLDTEGRRVAVTSRERVRGRIDWSATARERAGAGFDPLVHVTRVAQRSLDTPRNRVVRFLFERIGEAIGAVPRSITDGTVTFGGPLGDDIATGARLDDIAGDADQLSRHRLLRAIPLPTIVDDAMMEDAEIAKDHDYMLAATLLRRWRSVTAPDLVGLARCGRSTWVLPPVDGDERWLHVAAYCASHQP